MILESLCTSIGIVGNAENKGAKLTAIAAAQDRQQEGRLRGNGPERNNYSGQAYASQPLQ